jgi:hypothetical protein
VLDIEKAVVKYVKNPLNIHIYYTGQDHITEVSI